MSEKVCTKCHIMKPYDQYYRRKDNKSGIGSYCILCRRTDALKQYEKYTREDPLAVKKMVRNCYLKRAFGIDLEEYNRMFEAQKGFCKICGKHQTEMKRKLHVDHDHVTLKVRGLLCFTCNTALGKFQDSVSVLERAIIYLKESSHV